MTSDLRGRSRCVKTDGRRRRQNNVSPSTFVTFRLFFYSRFPLFPWSRPTERREWFLAAAAAVAAAAAAFCKRRSVIN